MKNYYQILGIPRFSTSTEILNAKNKVFRDISNIYSGDEKAIKVALMMEAYNVLSSKTLKSKYDSDFDKYYTDNGKNSVYDGIWNNKDDNESIISSPKNIQRELSINEPEVIEPILSKPIMENVNSSTPFSLPKIGENNALWKKIRSGIIVFCVVHFIIEIASDNLQYAGLSVLINYFIVRWFIKSRRTTVNSPFLFGFLVALAVFIIKLVLTMIFALVIF